MCRSINIALDHSSRILIIEAFIFYGHKLLKSSLIIIILFLICINHLEANDTSDSSKTAFERFIENIYKKPKYVKNENFLDLSYGLSQPNFPSGVFDEVLAPAYASDLMYGFFRINDKVNIPGVIYHSSEYIMLSNVSSHFKPEEDFPKGLTTDTWRFGFGIRNGYGYELGGDKAFMFYHDGAITWSQIDFEQQAKKDYNNKEIMRYDEEMKFGTRFGSGIIYRFGSVVHLNIGYSHSLVFPESNTFKIFGAWMVDNIVQRWIDVFEVELKARYGKYWPVAQFVYKTTMSVFLYQLRRNQMNWPFASDAPISFDSYKFGISFVF